MLRIRLRVAGSLAVIVPALLAGCGAEESPEILYNAGPATTLPAPAPAPLTEVLAEPPVLAEQVDRGMERTEAAVDATLERVDTTVSRAAERADAALRKADATLDQAVERVDATVDQAEQRADQAVGQAVDRARDATGRAAEGVRRVSEALDSFSRSLEREPRAPR